MTENNHRVSIANAARQYKEGNLNHLTMSPKAEVYSLSAVVIERIVDRAVERKAEFPPFGLIPDEEKRTEALPSFEKAPYLHLYLGMLRTLTRHADDEMKEIENAPISDPIVYTHDRLGWQLKNGSYPREKFYYDDVLKTFVTGGIRTSGTLMTASLRLIPALYLREGLSQDPESMKQAAANSYPFISKITKINNDDAEISTEILRFDIDNGPSFDSDLFTLREDSSGLAITAENSDLFSSRVRDINWVEQPTIGCPAAVNLGDRSAVRKLWDWHVEIAGEIYKMKSGRH